MDTQMSKYSLTSILLALILGFHLNVIAAEAEENPPPIEEMDRLVSGSQFLEAYTLGMTDRSEWEGDAEFDFLFGLAALESGQPNESVYALERAAALAPDELLRNRARLELARAYFITNNLAASENLFSAVLASNPPANVQQNINAFLQLIETRQNLREPIFQWTVSSFLGSDDNINSATSNGLIDTPLVGVIELNQEGQQIDDNYSNTSVAMAYNYPFNRNRSLDVTANLMHLDNFDTDQFDIDSLRAEVTYNLGSDTNRFRHGLSATTVNLDGEGFQDVVALNSSWQRSGSNGWYQTLAASYSQITYDTGNGRDRNDLRDVDQVLLRGGLTKIAGSFTHSLNIYHADEKPEIPNGGAHNGRDFSGVAYSVLYRMNAQHTPYLRVSIQDVEHDSEHPVFFNTTRSDDNESVTAGWLWQLGRKLVLTGDVSYINNTSNIELFDFSRFKYQAGFRYRF
jgi:tetratricopeptide (TPR) repeat protein